MILAFLIGLFIGGGVGWLMGAVMTIDPDTARTTTRRKHRIRA